MNNRSEPRIAFEPTSLEKERLDNLAKKVYLSTPTFSRMLFKLALNERNKGSNS